jgi:hypothetical protein
MVYQGSARRHGPCAEHLHRPIAAASSFIDRRNLYAEADAVPARRKVEVNPVYRKVESLLGAAVRNRSLSPARVLVVRRGGNVGERRISQTIEEGCLS